MTLALPPLPPAARDLCQRLNAPPALVVHLQLVHKASGKIVLGLKKQFPGLVLDEPATLFGAATHDLGQPIQPEELGASGE